MRPIWGILAILLAAVTSACGDGGCYDNGSALPLAQFRISGTNTKTSVNPVTIMGIGAPNDSVLIDTTSKSEFYLPLRATVNETRYRISFGDIADTITLRYTPIPRFVNAECGAMYFFRLQHVGTTTNVLDSIAIAVSDSLVTNAVRPSLYLYLTKNG